MASNKGAWNGECFTPGCTTTGVQGMSIWGPSPDNNTHRCRACHDRLDVLIPNVPQRVWNLKLIDRAAYDTWVQGVVRLTREELDAEAAPLLTRRDAVYQAVTALLDLKDPVNPAVVKDKITVLAESTDLVNEATIVNWWAAHCYGRADSAKPAAR